MSPQSHRIPQPVATSASVVVATHSPPADISKPASSDSSQQSRTLRERMSIDFIISPGDTTLGVCSQDDHEGANHGADGQAIRLSTTRGPTFRNTGTAPFVGMEARLSLDISLDFHAPVRSRQMLLSDRTYDDMRRAFNVAYLDGADEPLPWDLRSSWTRSGDGNRPCHPMPASEHDLEFPSKAVFESLIGAYVVSFQPVLPMFHYSQLIALSWQTVLAICAIGSHLIEAEGLQNLAPCLHQFSRRVASLSLEDRTWLPPLPIEQAQFCVLHAVVMLYCGGKLDLRDVLLRSYRILAVDLENQVCASAPAGPSPSVLPWTAWIAQEAVHRTAYAVMLVDTLSSIHLQQQSIFDPDDVNAPLPCHERLWEARTHDEWSNILPRFPHVGTPRAALQRLYTEDNSLLSVGKYSKTLLVYSLLRRLWKDEGYLGQPLSHWEPTAQARAHSVSGSRAQPWSPSNSISGPWRDWASDCLDSLHRSEKVAVRQALGSEDPIVLHLHFARVVLLAPYRSIIALAAHKAAADDSNPDTVACADEQVVRQWALQDQYKARLAISHAATLFWHVRRHSVHGFYEPATVAISTLTLWAFSAFSDRARPTQSVKDRGHGEAREVDDDIDELWCDIILLDRPTDHELIQQFVQNGHKMHVNMEGIGDLYAENGSRKVLSEGRRVLKRLTCCSISDQWIELLNRLIAVSCRSSQQQTS